MLPTPFLIKYEFLVRLLSCKCGLVELSPRCRFAAVASGLQSADLEFPGAAMPNRRVGCQVLRDSIPPREVNSAAAVAKSPAAYALV